MERYALDIYCRYRPDPQKVYICMNNSESVCFPRYSRPRGKGRSSEINADTRLALQAPAHTSCVICWLYTSKYGGTISVMNRPVKPQVKKSSTCFRYDMIWYDMILYDIIWYDMIWYYMIWHDVIWYDMIWYDLIWYDMILYDIIRHDISRALRRRFTKHRIFFWGVPQFGDLRPLPKNWFLDNNKTALKISQWWPRYSTRITAKLNVLLFYFFPTISDQRPVSVIQNIILAKKRYTSLVVARVWITSALKPTCHVLSDWTGRSHARSLWTRCSDKRAEWNIEHHLQRSMNNDKGRYRS